MTIKKIGRRGVLFSFSDPYRLNSYVILGNNLVFICDTGCGSHHMQSIIEYLEKIGISDRNRVVFNTHADYDHYWGNASSNALMIIGHKSCRERILKEAETDLVKFRSHQRGNVEIAPPTIVFSEQLLFADENVEMFYSPGHTRDSASLFDLEDRVLVVGDNIESPIPYITEYNLHSYLTTLDNYISMDWRYLVTGHDPLFLDTRVLNENRNYVQALINADVSIEHLDSNGLAIHIENLRAILKEPVLVEQYLQKRYRHLLEFASKGK